MSKTQDHLETKFIHALLGKDVEQKVGAVNVPIYLSSTFDQENLGQFGPFDYSRSGNPTRKALEETIAELEGGVRGFAFSSGMAAISSSFMLFSSGDHVLVSEDVYGGTYRFVTKILPRFGIDYTFVDMTNLDEVAQSIRPNTKLIYMETPSNPCLNITDIGGVVRLAKAHQALTFLDNTFMSPLYQNPIELGVDLVLHSATKFLSGHSDIIAGLAVAGNEELGERLAFIQNTVGAILGAQDAFHLIQGIKTLGARLKQSSESAAEIAVFLDDHPLIEKVYFPGLKTHPGHDLHKSQSKGDGAVLSFVLSKDVSAEGFVRHIRLPKFAVSLGAVESILSHPATMSHAAMPKEEREKRGISDRLFRLSVGLEHVDDLIRDLQQALKAAQWVPEHS